MVSKRSNALVHFHHSPQTADAYMQLCITLNGYTSATVVNIIFSLIPLDSMHFCLHYNIKNWIRAGYWISAFMHFYQSTEEFVSTPERFCKWCSINFAVVLYCIITNTTW